MLEKIIKQLSRRQKISIVVTIDIIICLLTLWSSFILRLEKVFIFNLNHLNVVIISVVLFIFSLFLFGVYKEVFRYVRANSIFLIFKSILVYSFIFGFIVIFIKIEGVPRSIGIIHPVIAFLSVMIVRALAAKLITSFSYETEKYNLLIYGAGNVGNKYISSISSSNKYNIIGFLDDRIDMENQRINSYRVFHASNAEKIIKKFDVSHILLAMPYLNLTERINIINKIKKFSIKIVSLPSFDDLALGKLKFNEINDVDVNDLLGRVEVASDNILLKKSTEGKNILVSGAGGSIGRELCIQILKNNPNNLILVDHNELGIFNIFNDLEKIKFEENLSSEITPLLCNICDINSLRDIFENKTLDTIYHAAAYKHVEMVEKNLIAGLKNNIFGTLNLCNLSEEFNIKNFILISSDKAVNSTNIMGASKRMAEMILLSRISSAKTTYSMVRFGNVLNSSGSVITLFRKQISHGGPVKVRDVEATRYFMTIEEAASLVIQAGAMAEGGDIFILEMGKPVKILDLAKKMIELSGMKLKDELNPDGDIEIEITKLKSGEKLHEELFLGKNISNTEHPKILRANEQNISYEIINKKITELENYILENDQEKAKKLIFQIIQN